MLILNDTFFVLVDVQEKLFGVMHERERLLDQCRRALACMRALGVPVLLTEQIPSKMGPTLAALAPLLSGVEPVVKTAFSACGEPRFAAAVEALGRKRVLVAGIESHVCVCQTAAELYARGLHVEVVGDAVSSRTAANATIGLERARAAGCGVTSVEAAVFELMRTSEHPAFREILRIVK
jgi:nicotinamidase-related amidase